MPAASGRQRKVRCEVAWLSGTFEVPIRVSRGTLRIVLKDSGIDPRMVTPQQFCVVLESVAPGELENRGVVEAHAICAALIEKIQGVPADRWEASHHVDQIFERLAAK
jgi:hypothetical protein